MDCSRNATRARPWILALVAVALWSTSARGKEAPRPTRYEFGGTPVLTGDSDIGFGFGALASLAHFKPGYVPFHFRVEALVLMTVKAAPDGGAELPYHDYYLKLDLPGLLGDRLRLNLQAGFRRSTNSGYYGMGNLSPALDDRGSRYHQYDRIYPQLRARARLKVLSNLSLLLGGTFTYNWINHYETSRLVDDLGGPDEKLKELLRGTDDHALLELDLGWVWDTRDHEITPSRGVLTEITWRFSPGASSLNDLAYGGLNWTSRFYHPLWGPRLVLAGRLMLDLLVGQPPFYQLANHGGLFPRGAIGGGNSVRGVPLHRYHGKVKLMGNLELRSKLLPFTIRRQRFNLGATLFVDTGRIWTDYFTTSTDLDGNGVGLKVGLGGGLRLQWGETFLLRADVAWSPDARPVGVYVDINHAF